MAIDHDPLSTPLTTPLSIRGQVAVISSLSRLTVQMRDLSDYATYFRYYEEQCTRFLDSCGREQPVHTTTHRHIIRLGQHLQGVMPGPTLRKREILELFGDELQVFVPPATDQFLSDAVDFVARLLLMMDIGRHRQGLWVINQDPINWSICSLPDLIATQFNGRKELDTPVRLERIFMAPNLELIGGIKIVWTDNLADHLRMSEDDTQVSIFSHIHFLKMNLDNPLFPPGFITETIRTLALLLPRRDAHVRSWLQKQQRLMELHNRIDRQAASEGRLKAAERQITKFVFWHDRLVILKQAFDESQPKNLRQWWNDRRNPVQWYNFWFAVALIVGLTVFFGVAATVEGAIQVYKAYHPSPSP